MILKKNIQQEQMQDRMLKVARKMMESKRLLQKEIKEDIKRPEIRAAIEALINRSL